MKRLLLSILLAVSPVALAQAVGPAQPPAKSAVRAAARSATPPATANQADTARTRATAHLTSPGVRDSVEVYNGGMESSGALDLVMAEVVALVYVGLALVAAALVVGALVLATGLVSATALAAALSHDTWAKRIETFLWVGGTLGGGMVGAAVGEGAHLWRPQQVGEVAGPTAGAAAGLGVGLVMAWLLVLVAQLLLRWWAARVAPPAP